MGTLISDDALDAVLAMQLTIAWAGEGRCSPRRLGWWDTDLIDEAGGGDFLKRLLPQTHAWASLEAVREAARRTEAILPYRPKDEFKLRQLMRRLTDELRAEGWGVLPISLQKLLLDRIRATGDENVKALINRERRLYDKDPDRALAHLRDKIAPHIEGPEGSHEDREIVVREAPRGGKPSWGGYIPQHLGFEVSQRMKHVLTETVRYPYVDEAGLKHIGEKRDDLGELLRRPGPAVQIDGGVARWWTFAGGRVNHTLKYGFEVLEGWKVVADNFQLRIEGDGIGHESVRSAITRMTAAAFWDEPDTRRAVLTRLPAYRLSKFQDCLPEKFALEVIERYLLDVDGTVRWLGAGASS